MLYILGPRSPRIYHRPVLSDTTNPNLATYINKGYDQQLVDKRVYKFLRRERDTLTIKPTAIRYRYQKQRLQARKQPPQVDPKQ